MHPFSISKPPDASILSIKTNLSKTNFSEWGSSNPDLLQYFLLWVNATNIHSGAKVRNLGANLDTPTFVLDPLPSVINLQMIPKLYPQPWPPEFHVGLSNSLTDRDSGLQLFSRMKFQAKLNIFSWEMPKLSFCGWRNLITTNCVKVIIPVKFYILNLTAPCIIRFKIGKEWKVLCFRGKYCKQNYTYVYKIKYTVLSIRYFCHKTSCVTLQGSMQKN